ncbi:hypothetical protein BHM03_00053541 [Ensete ventricosum]|nr:hypothetical protein BHM03_00053541 [Ensete ventricosum]
MDQRAYRRSSSSTEKSFRECATSGVSMRRGEDYSILVLCAARFHVHLSLFFLAPFCPRRFNWGLQVKNKAERVLKLLEKGPLLKEERARARKISRVIQGFGSFNLSRPSSHATGGSNSHYEDYNTPREENPIRDVGKESSNSDTGIRAQRRKTETTYRAMMEESKSIGATDGLLVTESKLFSSREEGRKVETLREDHPFSSNSDHETIGLLLTSQSW